MKYQMATHKIIVDMQTSSTLTLIRIQNRDVIKPVSGWGLDSVVIRGFSRQIHLICHGSHVKEPSISSV